MSSFPLDSESFVQRSLRLGLLALLGLAVIATLMALVLGASRYLRMPDGSVHARKAPKPPAVNPDDFFEQFAAAPAAAAPASSGGGPGAGSATGAAAAPAAVAHTDDAGMRPHAGEVRSMLRCAHSFAHKLGRDEAEPDASAVEDFRAQFEKVAAASPDRGDAWAGDVAQFVCATLDGKEAEDLARSGKLAQPLVATVNWHIAQWDAGRRRLREFEAQEKRRVESETVAAAHRVEEARQSVGSALDAAALGFGLTLALAACLVLAGIESSLRGIRVSLEDLASRDFGGAPLPLVSDEVDSPLGEADASVDGRPDRRPMDDPLEVEYQIPEEAIAVG